jgi:hypothetical protein
MYFPSKDAALGEAQIQRTRLQNEGLEGFEFTLEERTDALAALTVLAGSGLSLTQAAKIAVEFHGIQTSGISLNDAVAAEGPDHSLQSANATAFARRLAVGD